ncbi:MAG: GlsB/YeaQ/YmgE family stress response membrane protein [Propionicimonas sp.]
MLIISFILFGMLVGGAAQLILGRGGKGIDWGKAFVAGWVGSFVGGMLTSLLSGDGLELRPSGLIGSLVGAIIVTAAWRWWVGRSKN